MRGVLRGLKDRGYKINGFNAYTTSEVLIVSGLSSSAIRKVAGDRVTLRAFHFFKEERHVENAVAALKKDDIKTFLSIIKNYGNSSFKYLQNVYTNRDVQNQNVSVALAFSGALLLEQYGVSRVHGGGFAWTIQAFVKNDFVNNYKNFVEAVFGDNSCHVLKIRK